MPDLLNRLSLATTRWIGAARATVDDHVSSRSHVVVQTSDGRQGFALFGGFQARHQFGRLYLPTAERSRTRLVLHRPATAGYCRSLARRHGLVVFCGDSAPPDLSPDLLAVPVFVDMEMATPTVFEGPGARWTSQAKKNIARITRSRLEFDVVSGDGWVTEFHRRMLRPSLHNRYGAEAYVDSRRTLLRTARTAGTELIRVFQNGRWVAGGIAQSTPDGYRLMIAAWLDGDEGLLKTGVNSASYWFRFRRAAALGHHRILLGGVAPYLEDGVMLYKSQWGAQFTSGPSRFGEFRLLLEPSHPACGHFLRTHSIMTRGANGDFIVFSGRSPDAVDVTPEILRGIKRWYVWRDQPFDASEATSEEVPRALRPWLDVRSSPGPR